MQPINQLQQLKVLGDSQRLSILRRLMVHPATLSQLGDFLQESPAHIRHHLKTLEQAGFVELDSVNPVRGFLEKYYRASSSAYLLSLIILPEFQAGQTTVVIGSNDAALKQLQAEFSTKNTSVAPVLLSLDSLEGLVKLREGICQMATCHLLDPESAEYNRSFVRYLFPGRSMALFHMYHREGGLLVQAGNPRQIRGLADLVRTGIRMVNRERGSGIRVWLDDALSRQDIRASQLIGYQDEVSSHQEVTRAIQEGRADVGVGLQTSAAQANLGFIPLFEEPYDLVLSQETLSDARLAPFFEYMNSAGFRQAVENMAGYRVSADSGRVDFVS